MLTEERQKDLETAISQIERQFGKGSIMKMDGSTVGQFPAVSAGNLALDIALGIGGLPRGRIVEIYGPEASGKTTLALCAIAEVQKAGGVAAFIDAEHAFDRNNAKTLGVQVEDLLLAQPDYGEQGLEIAEQLVRVGKVDMVVIDSVAALVPKNELEGDMGDSHMGLHARLMSQALRKLSGVISKSNTIFIFINQLRSKIGVVFGNPETTTGGNALKFYSSVRLDVRRASQIKSGDEVKGHRMKIKIAKNKLAPPFRIAEVDLIYGVGISKMGVLLDLAVNEEIVQKSGTWFSYEKERLGQGRDNSIKFLEENSEIADTINLKVRALNNLDPAEQSQEAQEIAAEE
ncbi:MAG: recombinase RecA [SAR324 cluster bacterium]|jgi:recombination protein RecA|uniref:RecA family profile 2 domain-containing protein n=1 Tax=marine metagenome TaxID=408172 RepID=A0A381NPD8_9ZZZZ|nr:recombinase RecA [SAR324 cluster bacterium]HCV44937.1 recombinase RecA [Deltaproteobacteria bacterium]MDP6486711.1 recombinase RecA [SAR324 cluster bacterium]MDP7170037.1 recombinase RecA [SAR324 cluster bacterium]MDP7438387.1 recombinase RecA [SAR324 cluster bacterium]|tara:strand:+ start:348 stop:1385 length:1038 start_codon:yes stop_codon:yes gene_type:complete